MDKKIIFKTFIGTIIISIFLFLLGYIVIKNNSFFQEDLKKDIENKVDDRGEVRAIWISFLDMTALLDKEEDVFKKNVVEMFTNIKECKLNTIYLQVRPFADAVYPSKYFTWSRHISSNQKSPGYDPLKIMIEQAHKMNLHIEAWINPYRISKTTEYTNKLMSMNDGNIITKWLLDEKYNNNIIEYTVKGEKCLVLNPASDEVRDLITNGVTEIIDNYNVDGIHFDDYFYPVTEDTTSSERKNNVNKLIKQVYLNIKARDKNILFGISPAGVIPNCRHEGADVDTWLSQDGYIDYICPQIYWSDRYGEEETKMFSNTLEDWKRLNVNNTKMYIGLALYKASELPKEDIGWTKEKDNIKQQIEILRKEEMKGFALFSYRYLNRIDTTDEMAALKQGL